MKIKRFSTKMWTISWSIVGGFAVVIPGTMLLSEAINPGSVFKYSNKQVSEQRKTQDLNVVSEQQTETSDSTLIKKPKKVASKKTIVKKSVPSKTENELVVSYYQAIQSHYETTNPFDKTKLPSKILESYDVLKENAPISLLNVNSWLGTTNQIPSLPEQLKRNHQTTGFVISHDDLNGRIDLKIVVAKKDNNPNNSYAQDGTLNNLELAGKTVQLTGFENEKNLIKKQYDQWKTKLTLTVSTQNRAPLWNHYLDLNNLSRQTNQTNVIEKINESLPGGEDQKLHLLHHSLQARGYKAKIANVSSHQSANGGTKSSELRFNLLILNSQNQIVKDDFSLDDQSWAGIPFKLTNFADGQDSFLNIPIRHNFVAVSSTQNNKRENWQRLDISFENLTTKQEVTWYLQAVVRKNKVTDFIEKIKTTFRPNQSNHNARINTNVYAVSLNPEERSITSYNKHNLYDQSGGGLIAGGRENNNPRNNRTNNNNSNNGMRRNAQFWRVEGMNGLEKELKNLLSLATFTNTSNDHDNPFLA